MKKIRTLLLSVTLVTTAFAQTGAEREEAKRVILGERKNSTSYPKSGNDRNVILRGDDRTVYGGRSSRYPQRYPTTYGTSRERQIYEINRAYDARIYSIRHNRTLSRYEKERIIRQLENERRRKINQIADRYSQDRRYNDDACDDDRKNKRNKGSRYGWRNGKGNPHNGK